MHPILFKIDSLIIFGYQLGPLELHSYGVLIAIGFVISTWVGLRFARQDKVDIDFSLDLAFWLLLSGLLGSRLLFSIINVKHYYNACFNPDLPNVLNNGLPLAEAQCYNIFYLWEGGLVWYGGVLGALLAGIIFTKRRGVAFSKVADAVLGAVPLGHGFGRLGCLCAGCCWGSVTDNWLGVIFPAGSLPYREALANGIISHPLPLHPTQLYEALGEFAIFFLLLFVRHRRRFHGQVTLGFFILYPILRSIIEIFRGDSARGFLIDWQVSSVVDGVNYTQLVGISTSQVISLLVVIGALIWMRYLVKKRPAHK